MSPIDGGFILLARSITSNPDVFEGCPPLRTKLWVWMLCKAFWTDGDKLKRGQFITTIDEMREAMSYWVGGRKEVPTKDQIRNVYEAFSKATMITTSKTTRGMVITINNYETYQDFDSYETHTKIRFSPEASPKPTTKPTTKPTQDGDKQQDNSSDCVDNCITETHTETHAENSPKPTATPHDRESINKALKNKKTKRSLPEPVPNNGNNPDPQHPKPQDKPKPPTKQAPAYPQEIVEFVTNYQNHVKQTLKRQAPEVTPALIKNGCAIVDQIIRLDKFSLDEIRSAMRWAVKDEFWTANARSLAALRKKGNNGLTKFQNIFEAYERRELTVEELVERHEAKRRAANG